MKKYALSLLEEETYLKLKKLADQDCRKMIQEVRFLIDQEINKRKNERS